MTSKEDYCRERERCDIFRNEKASTANRGLFGVPWGARNIGYRNVYILTLHVNACNAFMVCHV